MKKIFPLILLIAPILMATTYVIKEGDKEVGRYDEADGKTETVVIPADKPRELPLKKETYFEFSDEGGYTGGLVETGRMVPDKGRKVFVSGRVVDVLTLRPVAGGKLIFRVDTKPYEVPVQWTGSFSATLPKPEKFSLSVDYVPPKGYKSHAGIYKIGELAKIPAEERKKMASGKILFVPAWRKSWVDLEFAAVPEKVNRSRN